MTHRLAGWMALTLVSLMFGWLGDAVARADAMGAGLLECPVGAVEDTSGHSYSCAPFECETDRDCASRPFTVVPPGLVCRNVPTCRESVRVRGMGDTSFELPIGHGPCRTDGSCQRGGCVMGRVCVPPDFDPRRPDAPLAPRGHGGCAGCSVPARGARVPSVVVVSVLLPLLAWRRRR